MRHKNVNNTPTEIYKHFLESSQHDEYKVITLPYHWPVNKRTTLKTKLEKKISQKSFTRSRVTPTLKLFHHSVIPIQRQIGDTEY